MDSGSNSAAVSWLGAFTWSALRSVCWLALVCAAFAACDSRAAVEEHTKETTRLLAEAKQRADGLGSEPKDIPELEQWLRDYEDLMRRLAVVEAQLEAVFLRATPKLDGNTKIKGHDFASEADEKQAKALMELRRYLQDFVGVSASSNGLHVPVRAKLWAAKAAEAHGREVESRASAWEEAIAAIEKHDLYGGMRLRVHEGLRPLGPDPDSRLWEFVHVASGRPGYAIPTRDRATGRIVPDDDMGIVLVLLPGGEFWMGAQKGDASKPNYDPQATDREGPVHRVTLSPFFVGKHEVTQGQWLRWGGTLPKESRFLSAAKTCPVSNVSWNEVDAATRKAGLLLPTEAQWEYACRAGTSTPWWTGADKSELATGAVFDDARLARVGSKVANRFGLFDTAGNVPEWCRDAYGDYSSSKEVDPFVASGPFRVVRGGSRINDSKFCRSAYRFSDGPGLTNGSIGFRVVVAPVLVQ